MAGVSCNRSPTPPSPILPVSSKKKGGAACCGLESCHLCPSRKGPGKTKRHCLLSHPSVPILSMCRVKRGVTTPLTPKFSLVCSPLLRTDAPGSTPPCPHEVLGAGVWSESLVHQALMHGDELFLCLGESPPHSPNSSTPGHPDVHEN